MSTHRTYIITTFAATILSLVASLVTDTYLQQSHLWNNIGLQKSYNTGIAFGLNLGPFQSAIIIAVLLGIAIMAYRQAATRLDQLGFGCIVGGGLANVVDRAMDGKVTDMVRVGSFPIFNIADVCINIGVALLIIEMLRLQSGKKQ